jgi:hypothetical protein
MGGEAIVEQRDVAEEEGHHGEGRRVVEKEGMGIYMYILSAYVVIV